MDARIKDDGESKLYLVPKDGHRAGANAGRKAPVGSAYGLDGDKHRNAIKTQVTSTPTTPTAENGAKAARELRLQSGHRAVTVTATIDAWRETSHP